jgi:hypothetical protein
MPEAQSRFLKKIIGDGEPEEKSFTSERQQTAQAFNLHIEKRDGKHSEGFGWSHYVGYRWTDEGEYERLVVLFGSRAVEIEGHNLKALVDQIREGQLNGVRELITAQAELKRANAESEPVISSVKTYPDFEELLKEIKGGDEHDTGFARKARGR